MSDPTTPTNFGPRTGHDEPAMSDSGAEVREGSAVEAELAEVHHEIAAEGRFVAHHHPEDPNLGAVRGRTGRGALLAATLAAAVTVAGVVALALAIGGR